MSKLYQDLDSPAFDYQLVDLIPGDPERYRGPAIDLTKPYVACIGGAQTFGRFVQTPFPHQLSERLGCQVLNLGLGGAGPRFALLPKVLPLLQGARLVVVQMFSGRSASNSIVDNSLRGRNGGRDQRTGDWVSTEQVFRQVFESGDRDAMERLVEETRTDYVETMVELGRELTCPSVLLWMSRRKPRYELKWDDMFGIMRHYPQLIDDKCLEQIIPAYDEFVDATSEAGLPQRLWQADESVEGTFRGEDGFLYNGYYPSPESHELVTEPLVQICRKLIAS